MNAFPRVLTSAEDVTDDVLAVIPDCVDQFEGEPTMPTEEFIDRLCDTYGGDDWELLNYDSPAARKIMRAARLERRERQS